MRNARRIAIMLSTACAASATADLPQTIDRADGSFADWTNPAASVVDPAQDASGAFDLQLVQARTAATTLKLRFDITIVRNLQSGNGSDGNFRVELDFNNQHLSVDLRNRLYFRDDFSSGSLAEPGMAFRMMPTHAAREFEVEFNLSHFGAHIGDPVSVNFSGSDALAQDLQVVLQGEPVALVQRLADRHPAAAWRIASLNTLNNGVEDQLRAPSIKRLIQSTDADVICLQEESGDELRAMLNQIDPDSTWTIHSVSSNLIASRFAMTPIPAINTRYAAAIVHLDQPVLVLSIHPSCCGYIGNANDQSRISQTQDMIATIEAVHDGNFGAGLADVPVVVAGDWNLVGSSTPLDMMTDPTGPGLVHHLLSDLARADVTTWRDLSPSTGSFAAGLLDLLVASPSMVFRGGHLLNSNSISPAQRSDLGLLADDSRASDHLMLVGDFAFGARADWSGDGQTTSDDFFLFLAAFFEGSGDQDGDGLVNSGDFFCFLSDFFGSPTP